MNEHSRSLARFVSFNVWANTAIAGFLADKNSDLLDREIISSFNSIRKTIFHMADGQYIWLSRLNGISPAEWPSSRMKPEEAIPALVNTSIAYAQHCEGKDDAFWTEEIAFKTMDGAAHKETVGNITMHLMNHSTFHRGQLLTMFRQAGFEGKMPKTDFIAYLREMAK
jgi:uncharacterized damage-inducible protein DinB